MFAIKPRINKRYFQYLPNKKQTFIRIENNGTHAGDFIGGPGRWVECMPLLAALVCNQEWGATGLYGTIW
jgi:hypothetical protein